MMINQSQIIQWLERLADVYNQNKEYLTQLDAAIGDADHGINMDRGFREVRTKLPELANKDIGTILKTTGMTLLSKVGGASGPLYGTFFMRAAVPASNAHEISAAVLLELLKAGVDGIVQRGRPILGDKTMFDVWSPALETMEESLSNNKTLTETLAATVARAEEAMKATIPLQARKGRASYLGERSIGHQDPGATSTYLMLKSLAEVVAAKPE